MIRRILSLAFVGWFLGLFWFAVFLPGPAGKEETDAVVVLTGGSGRFDQAMDALQAGRAKRMLVSGVDPKVRRAELEEAQHIPRKLSRCCIDLDKASVDTISNARETARWLKGHGFGSVRLVTSDWHMRRAAFELRLALPSDIVLVYDAVPSQPSFSTLFREYNKYVLRRIAALLGI